MRGDFWCKNDFWFPKKLWVIRGYGQWVNRGMGYERFDCIRSIAVFVDNPNM